MKKLSFTLTAVLTCVALFCSCSGASGSTAKSDNNASKPVLLGAFDKDSAYKYIAEQVAFGPRVPGTKAHDDCGAYLVKRLKEFGADTIIEQRAVVEAYNGDKLPINNIFASYNPLAVNRVLLVAHWDTRPWANMEMAEDKCLMPVPGANDGASGVGVILEIARNLSIKMPECGVDILFTDAEDYGHEGGFVNNDNTWCLGTQYWVDNMPYTSVNGPAYGILLDMVGGTDAVFHREITSNTHAKSPTVKIWSEANTLGFGDIFVNKVGGAVIDDHVFLIKAGIPTTDIIEHVSKATGNFPATWHTLDDDMQHISTKTLDAVGKTVLNVVYKEKSI